MLPKTRDAIESSLKRELAWCRWMRPEPWCIAPVGWATAEPFFAAVGIVQAAELGRYGTASTRSDIK